MDSSTCRYQTLFTEESTITLDRKLQVFLAAMIFCVSLFLMVNVTSVMAQTSHSDHTEGSLLGFHDTDEDGLSDELENNLTTDVNDKYGDKDKDGLYDFEEYLDHYGTPDNTNDNPRYNYNDNTTYGNILDIYHYFNLSENKAGHIRDNITYTEETGGFTNYLLWNVTFSADLAGGSESGNVTYENNHLVNVAFAGNFAGGSDSGNTSYINNSLVDVTFTGNFAGGSDNGDTSYINNSLVDVTFTEDTAGGSDNGNTSYINNHLMNVAFNKAYTGGSSDGDVNYINNSLVNITFNGYRAGGSRFGKVNYMNNTLINVVFSGRSTGMLSYEGSGFTNYTGNQFNDVQYSDIFKWGDLNIISENNTIVSDLYDSDNDSLGDVRELFELRLNPVDDDTDDDGLNDGWEVLYSNSTHVDPLVGVASAILDSVLNSNNDGDGLTFSEEEKLGTNPDDIDTDADELNDSYEVEIGTSPINNDSDEDGLNDGWEFDYNGTSGVNPAVQANSSELESDEDTDDLTLLGESLADTNPLSNDTDDDGLLDGWEALYSESYGVDPLVNVTEEELNSDEDNDSLSLREEASNGTNPMLNDTDGDGLLDGWEVQYNGTSGVNPTVQANSSELESDDDSDGSTLLGESLVDTDPSSNDTDGDGLLDGWETLYSESYGVDPLVKVTEEELSSDQDSDGLTLLEEYIIRSDPFNSDTDGDGLLDGWEALYSESYGVDPLVKVTEEELISDEDNDGLSLREEASIRTNPMMNDTDGDGLNDAWEDLYINRSSVNPLIKATLLELESDLDLDNLTLLEESIWGTDPLNNDTDKDGLNDGWEARYNNAYGVDPLIKATNEELFSDRDGDGLTLLQESIENMDPEMANNTEASEVRSTTVTQNTINLYFALFAVVATAITLATIIIAVIVINRYRRYRRRSLRRWRRML